MSDTVPDRPRRTRHIVFWCLYDWGNSAFPAIILSFVFAPYFLAHVASEAITGEAQWGFAISASAVVIAVASPVLGAFADKSGRRRPWLGLCSAVAIAATAAMWLVAPGTEFIWRALLLLAIANAAFELAYVFYNAMLPDVAPEYALGRISGFGWGAGYLGSLASLGVVMVLLINPDPSFFGLSREGMEHIRAAALLTAGWFLVFASPIVFLGPPEKPHSGSAAELIREGLSDLWTTVKSLRKRPSIAWFLIAHMFFIDGVNTLFVFGPLIAVGLFGFTAAEITLFGVTIYLAAGLGAIAIGWLDDIIGAKLVILGSIVFMLLFSVVLVFLDDKVLFWIFAAMLAVFFGPIQSSSRSLMIRLTRPDERTKFFGIYALAGRATAPLGPAAVGWAILQTENQRAGVVVVAVFLLAGGLMLLPVREKRK